MKTKDKTHDDIKTKNVFIITRVIYELLYRVANKMYFY